MTLCKSSRLSGTMMVVIAMLAATLLVGCPREGAGERTGEAIDQAGEDIREAGEEAVEEAEDAAEEIEDAVDQ